MEEQSEQEQRQNKVRIIQGNLYLDSFLYNSFFAGIESVALLPRLPGFFIMPVHSQASGGRLLKMRNAKGDRVVTATDFFQECGIDYQAEKVCAASWDSQVCALYIELDSASGST